MTIRLKLTLLFSGLFALLLLGFSLAVYLFNTTQREEAYYKRLKQLAITKTNLLLGAKVNPAVLQLIYKNSLNTLPQEEVAIYDSTYNILYHDAMDIDRVKETTGMLDSIVRLGEIHFYVDDLQAIGFCYVFQGKSYVITAAAKDDYGLSKLGTLRAALVIGFLLAVLATLLTGIFFSRRVLRPVSDMVGKVGEISASRLDMRIDAGTGKDEMSELALTFNQMIDRLENSFNAQKQFVSNISHELRTPLAAIITELEVAAINERSACEYKHTNRLILQEARKLSRLSSDLLDLAKASYDPSGISFRELRLDEILLDARQGILRANPDYKAELQFKPDIEEGDPIAIQGNEYLLRVAFANLIENACKFSADRQCFIAIDFQQKRPAIAFRDNGIGVPMADLPHIFMPFYRGENKTFAAGNGIGLSLTARIVQLHNGTLEVRSPRGQGTTFTIRLPNTS